ncbi:MAG: TetR/AcrR family transcriptional regulator [Pseudomonadota bacterium]
MNWLEMDKALIKEKKKYHHGDLRGQLLEAVRVLVERDGPDDFSVAEACREAGVSTAAPYKHFKDRNDILRGVVLLAMDRMRSAMQAAADSYPAGDPRRIAALGQSYVDFARTEPGLFQTMFGLTSGHDEDPELRQSGDETYSVVEHVVADHLGISTADPQARLRAYALWCFVHGHSFLSLDSKLPNEVNTLDEAHLLRLVGDAILPP